MLLQVQALLNLWSLEVSTIKAKQHTGQLKKRTNQQNAQINFELINLLLFNHSVFRPLNGSHHQGVQNP